MTGIKHGGGWWPDFQTLLPWPHPQPLPSLQQASLHMSVGDPHGPAVPPSASPFSADKDMRSQVNGGRQQEATRGGTQPRPRIDPRARVRLPGGSAGSRKHKLPKRCSQTSELSPGLGGAVSGGEGRGPDPGAGPGGGASLRREEGRGPETEQPNCAPPGSGACLFPRRDEGRGLGAESSA